MRWLRRRFGVHLPPEQARTAMNLLGSINADDYERMVSTLPGDWPDWRDGGRELVVDLCKRLGLGR